MALPVRVRGLTEQEVQKLQHIVRRGSTNSVRFRRAMMLLASAGGSTIPVIAGEADDRIDYELPAGPRGYLHSGGVDLRLRCLGRPVARRAQHEQQPAGFPPPTPVLGVRSGPVGRSGSLATRACRGRPGTAGERFGFVRPMPGLTPVGRAGYCGGGHSALSREPTVTAPRTRTPRAAQTGWPLRGPAGARPVRPCAPTMRWRHHFTARFQVRSTATMGVGGRTSRCLGRFREVQGRILRYSPGRATRRGQVRPGAVWRAASSARRWRRF